MAAPSVVKKIKEQARLVEQSAAGGGKPTLRFPVRSLGNVRYDAARGHFTMKTARKE